MASLLEFVALPVHGDAFLLRRDGKSILVDGGNYPARYGCRNVVSALKRIGANRSIDIAVCTHPDTDHWQGISALLQTKSHFSIDELWLPGDWLGGLHNILFYPESFLRDAIVDIIRSTESYHDAFPTPLHVDTALGDYYANNATDIRINHANGVIENEKANDEQKDFENHFNRPYLISEVFQRRNPYLDIPVTNQNFEQIYINIEYVYYASRNLHLLYSVLNSQTYKKIVDAAKQIWDLFDAASKHKGLKIRWFDYDSFAQIGKPKGGDDFFLEPVNAREVGPITITTGISAIVLLAYSLSKKNRESLVFISEFQPADRNMPGPILFCGDSPLTKKLNDPNKGFEPIRGNRFSDMLITTPHHGSYNNGDAYNVLRSKWLTCDLTACTFVTGGNRQVRLSPEYTKLPSTTRSCTHCPHDRSKLFRQNVYADIDPSTHKWRHLVPPSNACDCT